MLFKTTSTSTGDGHNHFAYVSKSQQPGQQVWTSVAENHAHELILDPATQMLVVSPAGEGIHTHEIEPFTAESQKDSKTEMTDDEEIVNSIRTRFTQYSDAENDSREKAADAIDFYRGDQWEDADKSKLASENRACITVNEIAAKVDMLLGYQRQNRTDVRFFPVESGDKVTAEVLTVLVKNVLDRNNFPHVESAVFRDEVIPGRGLFHAYVDYSKDVRGEIRVENMHWEDCWFGPHEKLDLSDCEVMIKSKMFAIEKIKRMYPDKAKELEVMYDTYSDSTSVRSSNVTVGDKYDFSATNTLRADELDSEKSSVRVYEMWERSYEKEYGVLQYDDGYMDTVRGLSKSDIRALEGIGITAIEKVRCFMSIYICAGNVLLDKRTDDIDMFPVVAAYAKKDTEGWYGKVVEVMDVQREINKRHSQAIDVVNRVAAYGYFYDDQTFGDPREENFFRQGSSTSGFVVKVRDVNRTPKKEEGVRMPTELVGMLELASGKLGMIMNITPEALGFNQREVSSVALMESRRNAMTAQEFLFDNLNLAKKQLAKLIVVLLRKTYTTERIMRIIRNPMVQSQEQLMVNQLEDEAVRRILTETDLSHYDVGIGLSPEAPSIRSANFSLLLELLQRGAPIPPEVVIEASDLPNKEKILGTLQAQAQAAAQAEKDKSNAEIQKSMIAANAKMAGKGGAAAPMQPQQM